jgi:hypothetical protein
MFHMKRLPDRVLDAPLREVDMSVRLCHCLLNMGYGTLRQVMLQPLNGAVPNMGKVTLAELDMILAGEWTPSLRFHNAAITFANMRTLQAIKLRENGKTFREIGEELGVCTARAKQIFDRRKWRFNKILPVGEDR